MVRYSKVAGMPSSIADSDPATDELIPRPRAIIPLTGYLHRELLNWIFGTM